MEKKLKFVLDYRSYNSIIDHQTPVLDYFTPIIDYLTLLIDFTLDRDYLTSFLISI